MPPSTKLGKHRDSGEGIRQLDRQRLLTLVFDQHIGFLGIARDQFHRDLPRLNGFEELDLLAGGNSFFRSSREKRPADHRGQHNQNARTTDDGQATHVPNLP
jgi:hypothetical protein